jgi:hypothetical protein
MYAFRVGTGALALVMVSTIALATSVSLTAPAGGKLILPSYFSMNSDCSGKAVPTVRIASPPANGRLILRRKLTYPSFPANNTYSKCNSRKVQGIVPEYHAMSGFVGSDTFTINAIFFDGEERNETFNVNVK